MRTYTDGTIINNKINKLAFGMCVCVILCMGYMLPGAVSTLIKEVAIWVKLAQLF